MVQQLPRVRGILARWRGRRAAEDVPEPDSERSTALEAPMNLLLRFSTESGPHTIIAPGIPLRIASDIAREMERAGHLAEFVDQLPATPMAERIKRQKSEKQPALKQRKITRATAGAVILAPLERSALEDVPFSA